MHNLHTQTKRSMFSIGHQGETNTINEKGVSQIDTLW